MEPQEIIDMIVGSERFAQSHAFEDRVYGDEPILRTGAQAFGRTSIPKDESPVTHYAKTEAHTRPRPSPMPPEYRKMRALGHKRALRSYSYSLGNPRLFYEQGKLMEGFEDDFEGTCEFSHYYPTYDAMSDYQLRCYFAWRTRLRQGEHTPAPISFVYVHAYEIICGIGMEPGREGYDRLEELFDVYGDMSASLGPHLARWAHDYVVFYGLPRGLLDSFREDLPLGSVALLLRAQEILIDRGLSAWPDGKVAGLPSKSEVLDALICLSRYRAEKSRFVKERRHDVEQVACNVFARMVSHCHKRRRIDYVEGLVGQPTTYSYTMFPSAVFWQPHMHADVVYDAGPQDTYLCQDGFWYRELPCRRFDTNKELGNLLHAIDTRMRVATEYGHPLKERALPKYQGKFVDEQIAELVKRRQAEKAVRITIDRSSLKGIRSAAARTREALLTDEERDDTVNVVTLPLETDVALSSPPNPAGASYSTPAEPIQTSSDHKEQAAPTGVLGLTKEQEDLLRALLDDRPLPNGGGATFLSLAIDAINEAFLDEVGDTVVEFDGDAPTLVEDYKEDVRHALSSN